MILLLAASASAADLARFAGTWGVDPSRSDDPMRVLEGAVTRPTLAGGQASTYSPDEQGDSVTVEEQQQKVLSDVLGMLGVSGTFALAPGEGGIALAWGGEDELVLAPGGGWQKLRRDEGTWKVRAREDGERLRIERRFRATWVVETLVPPEDDGEMVVVVRVDGTGLDGVEFRRVYRALERP